LKVTQRDPAFCGPGTGTRSLKHRRAPQTGSASAGVAPSPAAASKVRPCSFCHQWASCPHRETLKSKFPPIPGNWREPPQFRRWWASPDTTAIKLSSPPPSDSPAQYVPPAQPAGMHVGYAQQPQRASVRLRFGKCNHDSLILFDSLPQPPPQLRFEPPNTHTHTNTQTFF
jgi:hypothetical protein